MLKEEDAQKAKLIEALKETQVRLFMVEGFSAMYQLIDEKLCQMGVHQPSVSKPSKDFPRLHYRSCGKEIRHGIR